jgi:hypothetical protein
MTNYAVLTGDIINFTQLDSESRQLLIEETEKLIKAWAKDPDEAQVFRGDSYQLVLDDTDKAINRSIQLICWFKKHRLNKKILSLSTRISIGIGKVAYKGKTVLDSDGEAFHLSGRVFDNMSRGELLAVTTADEEKNHQVAILLVFINQIIDQWTKSQAEVIFLKGEGYTQQKMAEELGIQQGAVNNRLKAAKYNEVEKGINYIAKTVKQA